MDDEAGFRQFVSRRQCGLLKTAWLLTGDWGRAEDLAQLTLLKVWTRWSRVGDDADVDGYARKVMLSIYLGWRRRRWTGERPTAVLPERPSPSAPNYEERHVLADAVRSLPPRQRAVVVLRSSTI